MKEANEGGDLVPSEGYVEENKKDGVKSFRCKQCDKSIKTEKGVKNHIALVHKDQALKRTAANETNSDEVTKRKKDVVDDFEFLDESLKMDLLCDQVLSGSTVKEQDRDDLDDAYLEKLIAENSPATADDDVFELNPDQDHDYLRNEDEMADSTVLKVKVIKLETELRKKENERRALEDELLETKLALAAKSEDAERLKLDVENKQKAAEAALSKVNLLEEKNLKYCRTVKALVSDGKQRKGDHEACKKAIAEKEKLIKNATADRKLLAKRIEELENSMTSENVILTDQQKTTNDKLKAKTKELREAQNENKKAIVNERDMQEVCNEKNRKISELELALATTKSLLDYA